MTQRDRNCHANPLSASSFKLHPEKKLDVEFAYAPLNTRVGVISPGAPFMSLSVAANDRTRIPRPSQDFPTVACSHHQADNEGMGSNKYRLFYLLRG